VEEYARFVKTQGGAGAELGALEAASGIAAGSKPLHYQPPWQQVGAHAG